MPIVKQKKVTEDWGWQIVILQRGWVYVGRMKKVGYQCELSNAACVRRWGTTAGLGELASNGPLPETQLEPCKLPVRFHYLTSIACLECDSAKWEK